MYFDPTIVKYLAQVDEIMLIVDDIAEQNNAVPLAAFLFGDLENGTNLINGSFRDDYSPPMVSFIMQSMP